MRALVAAAGLLAACTRGEAPVSPPSVAPVVSIERFDGELGAARQKRRVLALASPS